MVVALVLIISSQTPSQIQIGRLKGTVTDQTGAPVPGATVTLDNPLTGFHNTVSTDREGGYAFTDVPFNSYALRVRLAGFKTATQSISIQTFPSP
jgi:hypothetical protein